MRLELTQRQVMTCTICDRQIHGDSKGSHNEETIRRNSQIIRSEPHAICPQCGQTTWNKRAVRRIISMRMECSGETEDACLAELFWNPAKLMKQIDDVEEMFRLRVAGTRDDSQDMLKKVLR